MVNRLPSVRNKQPEDGRILRKRRSTALAYAQGKKVLRKYIRMSEDEYQSHEYEAKNRRKNKPGRDNIQGTNDTGIPVSFHNPMPGMSFRMMIVQVWNDCLCEKQQPDTDQEHIYLIPLNHLECKIEPNKTEMQTKANLME